jgi:hypothetical protein
MKSITPLPTKSQCFFTFRKNLKVLKVTVQRADASGYFDARGNQCGYVIAGSDFRDKR